MMNAVLRLFIGLVVAVLLFVGFLNLTHLRRDAYMPPSACLDDIDSVGPGTVTGVFERGYGDHWWAGVDYRWYVGYTFTPADPEIQPDGTVKYTPGTRPYDGEVRISEGDYNDKYKVGDPISVSYDSFNPIINGVHGSLGVISRSASWFSGWLRYPIAIIIIALLVGEVMKRWIKQGDI